MKTTAFIIVGILIAAILAGSGRNALPLALMCLQILVFLAGFLESLDWKWVLTLSIWNWIVVPATVFVPTLCEERAFLHFAVHAAALFVKIFVFANVVGVNAGGSAS